MAKPIKYCIIDGCDKRRHGHSYCGKHYMRLRRHGDVHATPRFDPPHIRFWRYVEKTKSCWLWTGALCKGYGHFMLAQRPAVTTKAHRYAFKQLVGPIPDDMTIDHLCLNKACVNPDHMEIVTFSENSKRGNPLKSRCLNGHAFNDANTYYYRNGRRKCRTCERDRMRKYRAA